MLREGRKENHLPLIILLTAAACMIYATSDGIRNNYGIMLGAIIENSGLTYASVSFVLAVGQLFYGMIQPFFGILAAKRGNAFTLTLGAALTLSGLLLLPHCRAVLPLLFCMGFLLPAGTGSISYGLLLACVTPKIPINTVATISGILTASSGIGNAAFSPIIQNLLALGGIRMAMLILALPTALLIPLCIFVGSKPKMESHAEKGTEKEGGAAFSVRDIFAEAFSERTYRLLMIAFFTCGFHMALISNHLPSQFTHYGITAEVSSYAFSIYGIVTMIGSILSGRLCDKFCMKNVLSGFFGARVPITLFFLLLPKTTMTIFGFAALLGMTGCATVPPVSGIINRRFGAKRLATLYGFVFFIHQIGAFFGALLGGISFEHFGSYAPIWMVDMLFCTLAATVSFLIREER